MVDEIAVVEGLQSQVIELQIPLGDDGLAEFLQVVLLQRAVQQLQFDAALDVIGEVFRIAFLHFLLGRFQAAVADEGQGFLAHVVQQQSGRDEGVVRLRLYFGAGAHYQRRRDVFFRDAVEQVAQGFLIDKLFVDIFQIPAGLGDDLLHSLLVQRPAAAILGRDLQLGGFCSILLLRFGAQTGMLFTVQDVGAGDFVMAIAHQGQFHLVLDILDMHGAAAGQTPGQRRFHLVAQFRDGFMDAAAGGGIAAFDGQKGLGDGDVDFFHIEGRHLAVAAYDADLTGCYRLYFSSAAGRFGRCRVNDVVGRY